MEKVRDKTNKSRARFVKRWTHKDYISLAGALQKYGFEDIAKIKEAVKTKSESEIKFFLKSRLKKEVKNKIPGRRRNPSRFINNVKSVEETKDWPVIRKWQRIAQNQMMNHNLKQDYSLPVMRNICQKFVDEQEEPSSSEVVNVKAIYQYMLDCISGNLPRELPPVESALVLMLFKQMKEIKNNLHFTEELNYIQSFKKSTVFVPFHVKDEFKKKANKAPLQDIPGTVPIPEEVYYNLSRHRKLVQCFNPLTVPMWLLLKEQNFVSNILEG